MPKKNPKAEIIDVICQSTFEEIEELDSILDSDRIDDAFDIAIDEISTVLQHRYYNPRTKVSLLVVRLLLVSINVARL